MNNFLGQPHLGLLSTSIGPCGRVEADISFCMRVQNTSGNFNAFGSSLSWLLELGTSLSTMAR